MGIVMLNEGQRATLSGNRVSLKADIGDSSNAVQLEFSPEDVTHFRRGAALVLENIDREVSVFARPAGVGEVFAAGAKLNLSLTDASGRDQVMMTGLDVGNKNKCGLLILQPGSQGLVIYRIDEAPAGLSGLRSAARAETLKALERSGSSERRCEISLLIDDSASMQPSVRDGSVRAVVDVVTGVASVLSTEGRISMVRVGSPGMSLVEDDPELIGAAAENAMRSTPSSTGFGARLAITPAPVGEAVFVISDNIPPDLSFAAPGARPGGVTVVLLAGGDVSALLCEDTSATIPVFGPRTTQEGLASDWLTNPRSLEQIVSALVDRCLRCCARDGEELP